MAQKKKLWLPKKHHRKYSYTKCNSKISYFSFDLFVYFNSRKLLTTSLYWLCTETNCQFISSVFSAFLILRLVLCFFFGFPLTLFYIYDNAFMANDNCDYVWIHTFIWFRWIMIICFPQSIIHNFSTRNTFMEFSSIHCFSNIIGSKSE